MLGYLEAGALIGPFALGLVGGGSEVLNVAEFGVVMMLFLIRMEVQPSRLWKMRRAVLGLCGSQVILTTLALGAVALATGLRWQAGSRDDPRAFLDGDRAAIAGGKGADEDAGGAKRVFRCCCFRTSR